MEITLVERCMPSNFALILSSLHEGSAYPLIRKHRVFSVGLIFFMVNSAAKNRNKNRIYIQSLIVAQAIIWSVE